MYCHPPFSEVIYRCQINKSSMGEVTNFMLKVISVLLLYIQIQQRIIVYLMGSVLGKHVTRHVYDEPVDRPYRKLQVDQMPLIEVLEKLDYKKLLADYQLKYGKELKPVRRHKNTIVHVPESLTCGRCSAPSTYLYANN